MAHEVFEGDVEHRETLGRMLDLLGQRVGFVERQTAVVGRGMAFEENLRQLKERKLHYVVATRESQRDAWLRDFEDEEGFEEIHRDPSPLNPFQKKSRILLKRKCQGDEAYILCVSSERGEKDRGIREKQDSPLLRDMEKLRQRIADKRLVEEVAVGEAIGRLKERYPRVPRYHRICFDRNSGG